MTQPPSPLVIRIIADLEVGDILHRHDGTSSVITRLNPPTREQALAHGEREVWSLSSWMTYRSTDNVNATPSERRIARALKGQP